MNQNNLPPPIDFSLDTRDIPIMTRNGDDILWQCALYALLDAKWGDARSYVEELLSLHRDSAVDELPPSVANRAMPQTIRDRVALWNIYCVTNQGRKIST